MSEMTELERQRKLPSQKEPNWKGPHKTPSSK